MTKYLFFVFIFLYFSFSDVYAQQKPPTPDCALLVAQASSYIKDKQYLQALNKLEVARVFCPQKEHEVARMTQSIFQAIEKEKLNYKVEAQKIEVLQGQIKLVNSQKKQADSLLNEALFQKANLDSLVVNLKDRITDSHSELNKIKSDRDLLKNSFDIANRKTQIVDSILQEKLYQLETTDDNLKNMREQIKKSKNELSEIVSDREKVLKKLKITEERRSLQKQLTKLIEKKSVLEQKRQYAILGLSFPIILALLAIFFYRKSKKEKERLRNMFKDLALQDE